MRSVGRGDGMCPVTEAIASTWGMSGSWMTVLVSMGRGTEDELFRGPVEGDKVRWEWVGRAARDDGAVGEEEEGATGD